MYTIDPDIKELVVKDRNIEKVFFSMNIHQVATPEMILEEARSYILFFREKSGKLSSYIALHLRATNRKQFYAYSSNPFPADEMESVQEESLAFAEGLGAVLDEIDMTKWSQDEKNRWVMEQEIFNPKPRVEEQAETPPAEAAQAPEAPQPVQQPPAMPPQYPQQAAPYAQPPVQPAPQAAPVQQPPAMSPQYPQQAAPYPQPPAQPQYTPQTPLSSPAPPAQAPQPFVQQDIAPQPAPNGDRHAPLATAARQRREIVQKGVKAGGIKAGKAPAKRESLRTTGVVSRDREALARLFTSF